MLVVPVKLTVDAVVEQAELQTDVEVGRRLPCDLVITNLGKRRKHLLITFTQAVAVEELEVRDTVVTLLSDRSLEFEVVDPCGVQVLEELLLGDDPSAADAPEVTPAVVLGEAGGSVTTVAGLCEVALVVVIEHIAEVTLHIVVRSVGGAVVPVRESSDLLNVGGESTACQSFQQVSV